MNVKYYYHFHLRQLTSLFYNLELVNRMKQ